MAGTEIMSGVLATQGSGTGNALVTAGQTVGGGLATQGSGTGNALVTAGQTVGLGLAAAVPIIGPIVGGLLAIGSTIIGGLMQNSETDKANAANAKMVQQELAQREKQQAQSLAFSNKQLRQQGQQFQQQMGFNTTQANRTYLQDLGKGIMNFASSDAQFQQYLKNLLKV